MLLTTTLTLNNKARGLTRDTQAIHRTILHATKTRCQWALPDPKHLIIRHTHPVDWADSMTGIITQAITTPTEIPITGAPVHFGLIANPTQATIQTKGDKRGKNRPLPPEKWNTWLERKLGDALNLNSINGTGLTTGIGHKHNGKITHRRVLYTGEATIKNQDNLTHHLTHGVGRGKAYGCGLLILDTP